MLGVVLAGVCAPLIRVPTFYYWDDTVAASVAAWRNMGSALLEGRIQLLDIEMWRGGNYAAEAAFGLFNPLIMVLSAGTMPIDDLVVVTVIIKAVFFLAMALGAYLLSREYGARPWPAALLGSALPLSGFTLWMDGAAWVTGLIVTALTPWVWYTAKRTADGRGSALWLVLAGYLCGSAGNPYGLLSAGIVIGAVLVEALWRRRVRQAVVTAVAGVAVALLALPTYLPFLLSSSVSYREGASLFNDETLAPGISELVGLSSPSFTPYMWAFEFPYFTFPVAYLAWFVLPLAPWLRWSTLWQRGRELTGVWLVAGLYLMLVLGPSQVWFFRWPMRLLPYFWLAVVVLLAVVVSAGLHRSRSGLRVALSAGAVFVGFWWAWSDDPDQWDRHLTSAGLVAVLLGLTLWAARRSVRGLSLVAMAGTLVVTVVQLGWMPVNASTTNFNLPRSESAMEERFADYGPGLTVQVARIGMAGLPGDIRTPEEVYQDILFGSMYSVADVESVNSYSGVGFTAFDVPLCSTYYGGTCQDAWDVLWEVPEGGNEVLADLVRAETVVVQRALRDTRDLPAPDGWELAESAEYADIWRRIEPLPWPEGRLSDTDGPVEILADTRVGEVGESLDFRREGDGPVELTFARLAWPGYTAEIDGREVPVEQGPNGLLAVPIPEDVDAGTLTLAWSPPGTMLSLAAVGAAGLLVAGLITLELRARRSRQRQDTGPGDAIPEHVGTARGTTDERAALPADRTRENQGT